MLCLFFASLTIAHSMHLLLLLLLLLFAQTLSHTESLRMTLLLLPLGRLGGRVVVTGHTIDYTHRMTPPLQHPRIVKLHLSNPSQSISFSFVFSIEINSRR